MNILFVTISWPDPKRSNIYTDLIHEFRDKGHNMYVVTNNQRRTGKPSSFKTEDGIQVLRVKSGNISKTNFIEKGLSLLFLNGLFKRKVNKHLSDVKFDLIIFNTPPITLSGLISYLKKKYNCSLYLLLKDIWPYSFVDFDLIKRDGLVYNYFRRHEKKLYNNADMIGCMSPRGVDFLLNKHPELTSDKIEVCPNSVAIKEKKSHKNNNNIRKKYGISEKAMVFIFSGNLGMGQGLDFLCEAILELEDYENAFFLIGGAGTYFSKIKKIFNQENPKNALLYSYLPQDDYEELISTCDVGLILLDSKYSYPQFPSRLLSYLENKMAVLCAVNNETDIGEIVEKYQAGITTIHGDLDAFVDSVKNLSENRSKVNRMGENGFALLKEKYSVNRSYKTIMKHFT